jgi:uncharacterized membrane protein
MPVLMTLSVVLAVSYAVGSGGLDAAARLARWASASSLVAALVSTVIFNVPINLATGRWDADSLPESWKETRDRWEFFQGLRSWLLLLGFMLLCVATTLRP